MEMSDQYGQLPDLRHLMTRTTQFPAYPHPPDSFPSHRNLTSTPHFEMLMSDRQQLGSTVAAAAVGGGGVLFDFHSDATTTTPTNSTSTTTTTTTTTATNTTTTPLIGFDQMEGCIGGGDGGNGRWPRQETLTLLEIRSRLDHKFKEANQKGPLWDEVSRIMTEEHGYQRSGKKCREKFENLYKYYKKTKEGKAGRQDGKHYRFFRQLEALYGESSNPISFPEPHYVGNDIRFQTTSNIHSNLEGLQGPKLMCESLSISNSSEFDTSSAEDNDNDLLAENGTMDKMKKKKKMKDSQCLKRGGRRNWKTKIREFVDLQMTRLIETQEAWFEKMLKTLEHKEKERMSREEEWRKQEAERIDREHKFWANERAWFEARDAALMEALKKLTDKDFKTSSPPEELMTAVNGNNENGSETLDSTVINSTDRWPEAEISSLIHIRTNLESRFQHSECSTRSLWEEISANMAFLGYDRTAKLCEEKWDDINKYIRRSKDCNKKRKENSKTSSYFQQLDSTYNQGGAFSGHGINQQGLESVGLQTNDGPSPSNSNAGTTVQDSCFRLLMGEGENLWMNYGVKFNRGENQ